MGGQALIGCFRDIWNSTSPTRNPWLCFLWCLLMVLHKHPWALLGPSNVVWTKVLQVSENVGREDTEAGSMVESTVLGPQELGPLDKELGNILLGMWDFEPLLALQSFYWTSEWSPHGYNCWLNSINGRFVAPRLSIKTEMWFQSGTEKTDPPSYWFC